MGRFERRTTGSRGSDTAGPETVSPAVVFPVFRSVLFRPLRPTGFRPHRNLVSMRPPSSPQVSIVPVSHAVVAKVRTRCRITVRTKSCVRVQRVYEPFNAQLNVQFNAQLTIPLKAAFGRHAPRAARVHCAPGRYVAGHFPRKQAAETRCKRRGVDAGVRTQGYGRRGTDAGVRTQ